MAEFRKVVAYYLTCVHQQSLTLKTKQEEALFHPYNAYDVFALFPTGYRKSIYSYRSCLTVMAIRISKPSSRVLSSQPLGHRSTLASVRWCPRATDILGSLSSHLVLWTQGTTSVVRKRDIILFITCLGCCSERLSRQKFLFASPAVELGQTIIWSHWDISNLAEPIGKTWY